MDPSWDNTRLKGLLQDSRVSQYLHQPDSSTSGSENRRPMETLWTSHGLSSCLPFFKAMFRVANGLSWFIIIFWVAFSDTSKWWKKIKPRIKLLRLLREAPPARLLATDAVAIRLMDVIPGYDWGPSHHHWEFAIMWLKQCHKPSTSSPWIGAKKEKIPVMGRLWHCFIVLPTFISNDNNL